MPFEYAERILSHIETDRFIMQSEFFLHIPTHRFVAS